MAFERAKIEIKPAAIGTGIKVTLAKIKGGSAKLRFSVSVKLAQQFSWANGDKLEVMIGTGEHHGLIRLRKNNSVGDAEVTLKKGVHEYFAVALGHRPEYIDRSESARWVQFEQVEDGYIEIVLPRWAVETAPNRKPVAASAPVSRPPVAAAPVRRTDITASLMNDPPASRKEILRQMGDMKV